MKVIEQLEPNNWKVDAYYLPHEDGSITDVYIWQGNCYIDKLEDVGTFNTADCEQTEADEAVKLKQQKKIAKFNKWVKDNEIGTVGVAAKIQEEPEAISLASIERPEETEEADVTLTEDYGRKALEDY
mgnify:FL=1